MKLYTPNFQTSDLNSEQGLKQVLDYLFTLTDKLNFYMNSIGYDNLDAQTQERIDAAIRAGQAVDGIEAGFQEADAHNINYLRDEIIRTAEVIRNDFEVEIGNTTTTIYQTVSEHYYAMSETDQLVEDLSTRIDQNSTEITFSAERITTVESKTEEYDLLNEDVRSYMTFDIDGLTLGRQGSQFTARIDNEELAFMQSGVKVAWISNKTMFITEAVVGDRLTIGIESRGFYDWVVEENGSLSLTRRS